MSPAEDGLDKEDAPRYASGKGDERQGQGKAPEPVSPQEVSVILQMLSEMKADRARDKAELKADRARDKAELKLSAAASDARIQLGFANAAASDARIQLGFANAHLAEVIAGESFAAIRTDVGGISDILGCEAVADVVPAVEAHLDSVVKLIHGKDAIVVQLPDQLICAKGRGHVVEFDCPPFVVLVPEPAFVLPAGGGSGSGEASSSPPPPQSAPPPSPGIVAASAWYVAEIVVCEVKNKVGGDYIREFLIRIYNFKAHLTGDLFRYILEEVPSFGGGPRPVLPKMGGEGDGVEPSNVYIKQALAFADALQKAGLRREGLQRVVAKEHGGEGVDLRLTGYLGGHFFPLPCRTEALAVGLRAVWTFPSGCNVAVGKGEAVQLWASSSPAAVGSGPAAFAAAGGPLGPGGATVSSPGWWTAEGMRLANAMNRCARDFAQMSSSTSAARGGGSKLKAREMAAAAVAEAKAGLEDAAAAVQAAAELAAAASLAAATRSAAAAAEPGRDV